MTLLSAINSYNSFSIINTILIIMMMMVLVIIIISIDVVVAVVTVVVEDVVVVVGGEVVVLAPRKRFFATLDRNCNEKGNIIITNGCTVLLNIYSLHICYRVN